MRVQVAVAHDAPAARQRSSRVRARPGRPRAVRIGSRMRSRRDSAGSTSIHSSGLPSARGVGTGRAWTAAQQLGDPVRIAGRAPRSTLQSAPRAHAAVKPARTGRSTPRRGASPTARRAFAAPALPSRDRRRASARFAAATRQGDKRAVAPHPVSLVDQARAQAVDGHGVPRPGTQRHQPRRSSSVRTAWAGRADCGATRACRSRSAPGTARTAAW